MNEEVKKQIEIWQKNPDVYLGHGKGYRKMTVDDLVEQISQLHQKECESIVEEIFKGIEDLATEPLRVKDDTSSQELLIRAMPEDGWQALKKRSLKKVRGEK